MLTNTCMPEYLLSANPQLILDQQYSDFDEQAQRLTGHDQSYIQLTPGAFSGRFLSCLLGPHVSIHIEHCNQSLEQQIGGYPGYFAIGVSIDGRKSFVFNGQEVSPNDVLINPPNADVHMISPVNGSVLMIAVQASYLSTFAEFFEPLQELFSRTGQGIRMVRSPQLARRIREDVIQAVQGSCRHDCSPEEAFWIGEAFLAGICSKLSLELSSNMQQSPILTRQSYERYVACREVIAQAWDGIHDLEGLVLQTGIKRRSLQEAFTTHVANGPLAYHRIIRLHLARRAFAEGIPSEQSIGDIAAQYGFWNWSQFTQQYRNHFGELPSQTRSASLDRTFKWG